jgi:hypothetical protein
MVVALVLSGADPLAAEMQQHGKHLWSTDCITCLAVGNHYCYRSDASKYRGPTCSSVMPYPYYNFCHMMTSCWLSYGNEEFLSLTCNRNTWSLSRNGDRLCNSLLFFTSSYDLSHAISP